VKEISKDKNITSNNTNKLQCVKINITTMKKCRFALEAFTNTRFGSRRLNFGSHQ
jgi:hypothetical protein